MRTLTMAMMIATTMLFAEVAAAETKWTQMGPGHWVTNFNDGLESEFHVERTENGFDLTVKQRCPAGTGFQTFFWPAGENLAYTNLTDCDGDPVRFKNHVKEWVAKVGNLPSTVHINVSSN